MELNQRPSDPNLEKRMIVLSLARPNTVLPPQTFFFSPQPSDEKI
jgi:hypothetical protein